MNAININGLSVEESVEKVVEQLKGDNASAIVTCDDMATVKEVARIVGKMGCSCEIWPAEGLSLFVFSRITSVI